MTQRRRPKTDRQRIDEAARLFYDSKLRHDVNLRRQCSDRHVLDETIDGWKAGRRMDGLKASIVGISRSAIINSLVRRRLIHAKVTEANVVIWTEDLVGHDKDDHDRMKRIVKIVDKIRNEREGMEMNRNGIAVGGFESWENAVCRPGERLVRVVEIANSSNVDVLCDIKSEAASKQGFVVDGAARFVLHGRGASEFAGTGERRSITVSYQAPRHNALGIKKSLLVFDFKAIDFDYDEYYSDDDNSGVIESFSIVRYLYLRVGDPDDYDLLKPSAPYVRKGKPKYYDGDKFSDPVRVEGGMGGGGTNSRSSFVVSLKKYLIPHDVIQLASFERDALRERLDGMFRGMGGGRGGDPPGRRIEFLDGRYDAIDYSPHINVDNYATCMQHLLWVEELQMNVDIRGYDKVDVPLIREGRFHYKMHVPGLAESRPSVLRGDRILVSVRGVSNFEGIVHRTSQEYAIMTLPRSFDRTYVNGLHVDVRFTFSRTTVRTCHQALAHYARITAENDAEYHQLSRTIFPSRSLMIGMVGGGRPLNASNPRIIRLSQLNFYNRTLNQEQQAAVLGIVQSVARPAPYLIYGPPGTGKTVTLVESILQTIFAVGSNPNCKILVCAPSNTAVDVVVERLSTIISSPRDMLRLIAFSRDKGTVPTNILRFAKYDEQMDCFANVIPDDIKKFKIVAVTTSYAGRLYNLGIADHFSHVFIDEAGHSTEPDALGCLALASRQSTKNPPVTVLAGDPKQLGPIIRSDIAKTFGLEKSLLERLSHLEPYARLDVPDDTGNHYDKNMITRLVRNYRSHKKILDLPSKLFYDGDLIPSADMTISNRFVDWEHLPKRGFPIIFDGVEGEDMREANSPSWFNPDEAQIVKKYVDLLVKDTKKNRCKPEDIGIIAPYHKQVQKIRMILGAHGYSDCKVGSVEEFQGSERPVIIISTVRSTVDYIQFDKNHKLGFLANEKRFNVAVTRAQSLLIMIGNPFTLENDPNWESMIDYVINGGGYIGVEYKKANSRDNQRSAFEGDIGGIRVDDSDDEDGLVDVSHVAAQEGPAWRSEE